MRTFLLRRSFIRPFSKPSNRFIQMRLSSTSPNDNPSTNQGQTPVSEGDSNVPHFTFSEEPLGIPASEGYGYFQGGPGTKLGPNDRFLLQAKLGFGTASSVWLARDLT